MFQSPVVFPSYKVNANKPVYEFKIVLIETTRVAINLSWAIPDRTL